MSGQLSKKLTKLLGILPVLFFLNACGGGGTVDITAEDEATFVGSVSVEKKLSERSSLDISYLATAGSNSQAINTGIQFNGSRVSEGVIENDYIFHAVTAHYNYTYFLGKRFRLTAAPALQFGYADLEGSITGLNPNFNETLPAYGLRLGSSFNFTDRTSTAAEFAVYDQRAGNTYTTAGIWVEHNFSNDLGLRFGYSTHHIEDGDRFSSDRCTTPEAEPENCEESGFAIHSTGLHLGLEIKR